MMLTLLSFLLGDLSVSSGLFGESHCFHSLAEPREATSANSRERNFHLFIHHAASSFFLQGSLESLSVPDSTLVLRIALGICPTKTNYFLSRG